MTVSNGVNLCDPCATSDGQIGQHGGDRAELIVCSAKEDIRSLSERVGLQCLQMNAHDRRFCGSSIATSLKLKWVEGSYALSEGEQISPA